MHKNSYFYILLKEEIKCLPLYSTTRFSSIGTFVFSVVSFCHKRSGKMDSDRDFDPNSLYRGYGILFRLF